MITLLLRRPSRVFPVLLTLVVSGCTFAKSGAPENPVRAVDLTPSAWSSLTKPGPSHQLLDLFAGQWKTRISLWSEGSEKPALSTGKSVVKWILGGRFLREEFTGDIMGVPFEGMGLLGYDNAARHYSNVWIDSLGTTLASGTGKYYTEQNKFEFTGEVYDPLQSRSRPTRTTIDVITSNEFVVTTFEETAGGKEIRTLEIRYERVV